MWSSGRGRHSGTQALVLGIRGSGGGLVGVVVPGIGIPGFEFAGSV